MQAKVMILTGSASDLPVMEKAAHTLGGFGVPFEMHILSAHRCPLETADMTGSAAQRGIKVIIAAAGMAAHLAGTAAANTLLPVIGVPVAAAGLGGIDALLSTVQMPPGVPVATVGIGNAVNAALLAIQMLAINDENLQKLLADYKSEQRQKVLRSASELDKMDLPFRVKD